MNNKEEYLTFVVNDSIKKENVTYKNRYGITLAGHLYYRKDMDAMAKYRAIVIGPPHGGVKEQGPGVYANELAQQGFVVLTYDPSFMGESGGESRHVTSPEIFTENFSAGVDFLGTLPYVDRDKIGEIGICGSGGFALSAASVDYRIKAVVTSAMYDISGLYRDGWNYQGTVEQRKGMLESLAVQRWKDVDAKSQELAPQFPLEEYDNSVLDPITSEFFEYYCKVNHRGWHPNSVGAFTLESAVPHINFGQLSNLEDIAPRKVLLITGDQAHSKWFSEKVYEQIPDNSELLVVPGARHIDLYDRTDLIPFTKITEFFTEQM